MSACAGGGCYGGCSEGGGSMQCTCGAACGSNCANQACAGGCTGGCGGGCKNTCTSCSGCSSCSGCTGCSGCTSCTGCSGTCNKACNAGCSGLAAEQAYQELQLGLNEYITEQDLKNIYLIFEAIKNRRADANISTTFTSLTFTKDSQSITADDIKRLSQNAANTGFAVTDNTIIQNEKFLKETAEKLRVKAIEAYPTHYGCE